MRKIVLTMLVLFNCNYLMKAQININLIVQDSLSLGNISSPQGLCWDGNNFWIVDDSTFSVYKLSSDISKVDTSFSLEIGGDYQGVTFDGQYLATIDNSNREIQKIDRENGLIAEKLNLPRYNISNYYATDIAWDGNDYFITIEAGWSSQIAKVEKDTVSFVVFTIGTPSGLICKNNSFYFCYNNNPPGIGSTKGTSIDTLYNLPVSIRNPAALEFVNGYFWILDSKQKILFKLRMSVTSIQREKVTIPTEVMLFQNYPNPFNPITIINYKLAISSHVTLKIYDVLGREIAILVNDFQTPGSYQVQLTALDYRCSSGIYFYTLRAGKFAATKKMLYSK